jgi:hypothetical protein
MSNLSLSRQEFLKSEEADLLREQLQVLVNDPSYNTNMMYTLQLSDGSQFVEKHMAYMANHLRMDHRQYVLNVKLMTRL